LRLTRVAAGKTQRMNIGLRQLLLALAVVLFVVAVFSDTNYADLLAWGLAALAAAFLVTELGFDTRLGPRQRR